VTIEDNTDIRSDDEDRRSRTTRMALVAMLVVLLLLLVGLMAFVVNIVTPAGSRKAQTSAPAGLTWVRSIYGYGRTADQLLKTPVDVAIGSGGRIWVTDPDRARIFGFNPDGSYATLIHRGPAGPGAGRIQRTEGIGTDEDGNLYVCDYGNEKVLVFGPDGTFVREWSVPLPTDVAVRGGRVVVSSIPGVSVFTTTGTLMSVWGKRGRGPDEFDAAHGVALAADGTAYIADTQNQRVKAYDKDGKLLWIWPVSKTQSPMPGLIPTGSPDTVQMPTSVALDGNGRLIVVDAFGFDLVVLNVTTKAATLVARYGDYGEQDGFFNYPTGIAYDADRDWIAVADTFNNRVQILQIPGTTNNAALAALRRSTSGPWAYCAVPLGLLVLAALAALWVRRARRRALSEDEVDGDGTEEGLRGSSEEVEE
jgi:DNA-binding beta-propeller fold protein YncE